MKGSRLENTLEKKPLWHDVFNDDGSKHITISMNNFFRALIAGYGAKKLGGGCFGTIIVFIIIWVALGQCQ
jgi:hypothetical protein